MEKKEKHANPAEFDGCDDLVQNWKTSFIGPCDRCRDRMFYAMAVMARCADVETECLVDFDVNASKHSASRSALRSQ